MITDWIKNNTWRSSWLRATCSAPEGSDFASNGEQTATNPFAVFGERAQLITSLLCFRGSGSVSYSNIKPSLPGWLPNDEMAYFEDPCHQRPTSGAAAWTYFWKLAHCTHNMQDIFVVINIPHHPKPCLFNIKFRSSQKHNFLDKMK